MYITKDTKKKDLPEGAYILHCDNYESKQSYYLINKRLAKNNVFNTAYAFSRDKASLRSLKGLYKAYEIPKDKYKLYNI